MQDVRPLPRSVPRSRSAALNVGGVALLLILCLGTTVGCGADSSDASDVSLTIDDVAGLYGPLALGGTEAELAAAFGERQPASEDVAGTPLAADEDESFGPPDVFPDVTEPVEFAFYRYDYSVFDFMDGKLIVATAQGNEATTSRGVSIGDPLEDVDAAYPERSVIWGFLRAAGESKAGCTCGSGVTRSRPSRSARLGSHSPPVRGSGPS
jgi:hypothetical protein